MKTSKKKKMSGPSVVGKIAFNEGGSPQLRHIHIPIKHGHLTWTSKNPPSKEQMEAFETLADFVFNHPEKLAAGSLKTIPETIKKVSKKTKIPEICLSCGQMNSENCDTCQKPYNLE
jgi:hypothetical protein